MLPQLGIILPPAKVIKYFKSADTSGDGEIDVDEFKMAVRIMARGANFQLL